MEVLSCRSLQELGVPLLPAELSLVKKKREK